jgi:SAM-dependent methyltransferase
MSIHDPTCLSSLPEAYARHLGPCLLLPFAEDLARRLSRLNTGPLLEIAAGTGELTQALAESISAGVAITATDPDRQLIEAARRRGGSARVTWQQADPALLPFQDRNFGIIACQFAIATMPNRALVLREARRIMRPGGRFVFSVPGALRHNPVVECIQAALHSLFPADPPEFLAHGLHGYAEDDMIDDDLTAAGFTEAMYTNVDLPFVAPAEETALGHILGTPLRSEVERRAPDMLADAVAHVGEALRRRFRSDTIRASMRAIVVSASA